mmetsp:Transcript_72500/g.229136  ORF Transcript_72500/g.229136 Transcript_72500/m.229136 type:complete len:226 (-) Transcript_72500:97-774(-)
MASNSSSRCRLSSWAVPVPSFLGAGIWPPPLRQPPGQAMISTKCPHSLLGSTPIFVMRRITFWIFLKPCAATNRSSKRSVPGSRRDTSRMSSFCRVWNSRGLSRLIRKSSLAASLKTCSMKPPDPALARTAQSSGCGCRSRRSPRRRSVRTCPSNKQGPAAARTSAAEAPGGTSGTASPAAPCASSRISVVVSTVSTSRMPLPSVTWKWGLEASIFLSKHGWTET